MRLLLDTHAFLWAYSEPAKLPAATRKAISDPVNEVFVSAVSLWEISIKIYIGKLKPIGRHPSKLIQIAQSMDITPIPLLPAEAVDYVKLKNKEHRDPFDRMLIWQAISLKLTLISGDKEFKKFDKDGLKILWK